MSSSCRSSLSARLSGLLLHKVLLLKQRVNSCGVDVGVKTDKAVTKGDVSTRRRASFAVRRDRSHFLSVAEEEVVSKGNRKLSTSSKKGNLNTVKATKCYQPLNVTTFQISHLLMVTK